MKKTWLVMRNEIIFQVTRRSWLLITFGLPLIVAVLFFVPPLLRGGSSGVSGAGASSPGPTQLAVEGYVDHSGLVKMVPEDLQSYLLPCTDEASARHGLQDGTIAAYYVVPPDYVQSGELIRVAANFTAFSPEGQSWAMRWVLLVNLLGGDIQLAQQVSNPMDLHVTALSSGTQREVGLGWTYWIPYATGMILYVVIIMSSSLLRSSMGGERKNRVLEILMLSVSPKQILSGKIIALALVGLVQTVIWAGGGYALVRLAGQGINLPADVQVPFSAVVWSAVFFLLGYAVYASLLAGLGALTGPNVAGSSSADFVVIWPLIIPIFFMSFLISSPNGALAVLLSLFPLTAPIAMLTRMAAGGVPWWQPPLAAAFMAVTAAFVLRAVASVFRAQILLSGQTFTTRRFLRLLLSPASET
jgi:ABC-2 type transport system permease protein